MKIPAFVTVRTASTRLPNKCLLPFGEEGNVLEHVIARAKFYDLDPIICTTIERTDDVIEGIAFNKGVRCFRGSVKHKLQRWLDCCKKYGIEKFHTVDADDPFFDGNLIRRSYALLNEGYDMVYPTDSSKGGGASVGFSLTRHIISLACESTDEKEDTEMMWYYLEKIPGIRTTKLPEEDIDQIQVRLTLDYEEDYWLLRSIQRIVGSLAPRKEVDKLFRLNPELYKINWFRNSEWQEKQLSRKI